eukprot:1159783-Pelagomonas_calceolata.AAC.5
MAQRIAKGEGGASGRRYWAYSGVRRHKASCKSRWCTWVPRLQGLLDCRVASTARVPRLQSCLNCKAETAGLSINCKAASFVRLRRLQMSLVL